MAKIWIVILGVYTGGCLAAQDRHFDYYAPEREETPKVILALTPRIYYEGVSRKAGLPDSLVYRDFQMAPRLQVGIKLSKKGYVHAFADVFFRSVNNELFGDDYFTMGFGAMSHWAFRKIQVKRGLIHCYPNFYTGIGFTRLQQEKEYPHPRVGSVFRPYFNVGNGLHFFVSERVGLELIYMIEIKPAIYWQPVAYFPLQVKLVYSP
ncbi:MAG: hypothetical protein NXI25_07350 [bacterium]|nr:hypothetical protein [bacterium]